jgi:hypothetical protein
MNSYTLKLEFEKETGIKWSNSQGEPDIDYVEWLEQRLMSTEQLKATKTAITADPLLAADVSIEKLFSLLARYGGSIISSNDLCADLINQARAAKRMFVDDNSLGYIWEPPFAGRFPETEKEVEMSEWCYPLEVKLPDELKNIDWIKRIIESDK